MSSLIDCIKSDFYKLKHTHIFLIHFLIPLIGITAFLAYYSYSPWDDFSKIHVYFNIIAAVFPLIIGIVCSMVIYQEEQAGQFQQLLCSTKWRGTTFISKLIMLLILSAFSIGLALLGFRAGFKYIIGGQNFSIRLYSNAFFSLFLGNIFLYILHIYLSLELGKGASIGVGIVGSLLSLLMRTGLGDSIWQGFPWAWGTRFCSWALVKEISLSTYKTFYSQVRCGKISAVSMTCAILIGSLYWFSKWNGRKSYE